jgi:hypothetical protein
MQVGIFGLLTGTSTYLLVKKNKEEGNDCSFDFTCQNCNKNKYCKLPEASIFRLDKRKNKDL